MVHARQGAEPYRVDIAAAGQKTVGTAGMGEAVAADEPLVELETDKVTVEVPAPVAGVLSEIKAKNGDTVAVGALLGSIPVAIVWR